MLAPCHAMSIEHMDLFMEEDHYHKDNDSHMHQYFVACVNNLATFHKVVTM
jgi:hypothetical protein